MPWGVAAGVIGSVAGSAISSAMAPSASGGSGGGPGSYYVPTGLQSADQQWQDLQNQNYNIYKQAGIQQYGEQSLDAQLANVGQYAPQLMQGANQASAQYGALGQQLGAASGQEFGAGNQLYQTAFDPQNALYNRTVQQLQDQTGATNSMYGLGSSAAGAGVANQALGNFNIDWQNQQLQRQLSGVQGMGQAYGQAGQLGAAGAGYTQQGSQLPYQTAQSIAGAPAQYGGQYGQYLQSNVYGPAQGIQNQAIPYMNYGQGAQAVPYQNQTAGAGAAGALASQGISALGNNPQVQQGIAGLFGGSFQGGGYGSGVGAGYGGYGGGGYGGSYYSGGDTYGFGGGGGNSYGFTM